LFLAHQCNFYKFFRALYSNSVTAITAFINQAIAETNQGYVNSRVPITMVVHCIVDSSIASVTSFSTMLSTFTASASRNKSAIQKQVFLT
jgi:hypothetical protein